MVVKVNEIKNAIDKTNLEINLEKLWKIWEEKEIEKRIKEFADYLYNVRSKFTHRSVRTFFPTTSYKNIILLFAREQNNRFVIDKDLKIKSMNKNDKILFSKANLKELLHEILKEIIKKTFT
jgi:hypothetical protein